ncbi:MAG: hypothetical protein WC569_02580 [Candidatus Omnitrophota bacterium]
MRIRKKLMLVLAMLAVLVMSVSGCGLIRTALSIGLTYGIYEATK